MTEEIETKPIIDEAETIAIRREKLALLRKQGPIFPNDFKKDSFAEPLISTYGAHSKADLETACLRVRVAGRMVLRRIMGKASFLHVQDSTGRIQAYLRSDALPDGAYEAFKQWDLGDILGISGFLFKTNTNELSIHVENIILLTKAIRPLPDKFHGLSDLELRYRQRYVDLIANEATRKTFLIRSHLIQALRTFMLKEGFLEVETPMLQSIPGGALARPFITHHNALDMTMYLRIAPELYLKRLVVGGFEKVFEINRNFRNEGLSTQHNPEFTMIEFYHAYANYRDLMPFTERMFRTLALEVLGTTTLEYQGHSLDLTKPFAQISVKEAILMHNPTLSEKDLFELEKIRNIARTLGITVHENYGLGKIQIEIFEKTVEAKLIEPVFITEYPTEVSPLARPNDEDPFITDRFELFICGREIANGFSELNDPEAQSERFMKQVRDLEAGDQEAMHYDADYIQALEYGLPPTAGEGIGIDRLVMLFTNAASIRDVILFPHMRIK